ncbi:MAG: pyridoxamine kinase [Clostridiaceae bacterium]|nr:pyridoxamine kinase [Clostridiaceae bacterium]
MAYKRILTIQDISCLGQCSLTVALPILSAGGMETSIIPSAILSTHTAGFKNYTFHDLTEEIPKIKDHWVAEDLKFDAIYTGYLGSTKQINYVKDLIDSVANKDCLNFIDPAMADHGKLYPAFDMSYVEEMKKLVEVADFTLPNLTEACFLTGIEYKEEFDKEYILSVLEKLVQSPEQTVILTGIGYRPGKTGVVVYQNGEYDYYEHDFITEGFHGTGDVYSSAFVAAYMNGKTAMEAAKIAADYTLACIKFTEDDRKEHWYGVKFEPMLPKLIEAINK